MRYKIKNIEIRSENAAKPMSDASGTLISWLSQRDYVNASLDYGCGKLRYTANIAQCCRTLGIVDSRIQLTRLQRIDGHITTVIDYARTKWKDCIINDIEKFWKGTPKKYDFVLCANVLSAIPNARSRAKSLRAIREALVNHGELLVVNQHANSYFKRVRRSQGIIPHLDGWIMESKRGGSYYGILNRDFVIRLLRRYDFVVKEAWVTGQSNYVLAERR